MIATGKQYSIKQFINLTAKELKMKLAGKEAEKKKGYNEYGFPIIE